MTTHTYIGFSESLDEDDYGIMLNSQGRIKGVWIPKKHETIPVPIAIAEICLINFGVDPNKDENLSLTVH